MFRIACPRAILACLLLAFLATSGPVEAKSKKKSKAEEEAAEAEDEPKSIAEVTEESDRFEGLFTVYQDRKTGKLHLAVLPEQMDREFIYFRMVRDGVAQVGRLRGGFGSETIFSVRRHFDRIEFVRENTAFYYDPNSALSRAANANVSHAVLAVEKIVAEDEATGIALIEADDLFLTEALSPIKPAADPHGDSEARFSLGSLSQDKSKVLEIHNYPENTIVVVEYVYDKPDARPAEGDDIADARFVSISVQHNLIQVPDNDFEPRYADPRIGYFVSRRTDMTSQDVAPYRDVITRWNLRKKDPAADLSEPIEPIVFWIENTTPVELRPMIKRAGEGWNPAFEKAGFKNAVVIKEQPDDAEWDAGDLRYNVLRWTSSPNPLYGGYGPSFYNPRTGQILGADIMLEYVYLTNRLRYTELFEESVSIGLESEPIDPHRCSFGRRLHQGMLLGRAFQAVHHATLEESNRLLEDGVHSLILHEIGHTLGLSHNMMASQMLAPEQVTDRQLTARVGLTGSAMDYEPINLAVEGAPQGQYYNRTPGPYDLWAIEYGYSPSLDDAAEERARLDAILARSTEPALQFGNDADDMRAPGGGVDPRIMVDDLTNDAIGYAADRMGLIRSLMPQLVERLTYEGESFQRLLDGYQVLTAQYATATAVVSRYVGGIYIDRAFVGQPGATAPYRPVPPEVQRRAMTVLEQEVFAPDAFDAAASLYDHLQVQRRDFDLFGKTEDPKIHRRVLEIQGRALDFLLDPVTLARVSDTALYGNEYGLTEVGADLTSAIFDADVEGDVNSFRQNLQIDYVERLIDILGAETESTYDHLSEAMALANLRRIERLAEERRSGSASTRAHAEYLAYLIDRALEPG